MRMVGMVLLVAAQTVAGFQNPSVSGRELTSATIEIDLQVETDPGGSVVAHLIEPGGPQQTVALRERSPGVYGALHEVRKVDLVVVFEAVGPEPYQSEPARLSELGLDRALLGMVVNPPSTTIAEADTDTRLWGWLGLGLGAASLALLAVWVLGGSSNEVDETD